jgi:hypothetical protein
MITTKLIARVPNQLRFQRTNTSMPTTPYRLLKYAANVSVPPKALITGGLGQLGRGLMFTMR